MPILNSAVQIAAKPFPKAISPKTHAIIDYITVGSFFATAAWFWGRSKRAAIAALISGGAELAVTLLTNYPGGVKKVINFRTHRDIDFGLGNDGHHAGVPGLQRRVRTKVFPGARRHDNCGEPIHPIS